MKKFRFLFQSSIVESLFQIILLVQRAKKNLTKANRDFLAIGIFDNWKRTLNEWFNVFTIPCNCSNNNVAQKMPRDNIEWWRRKLNSEHYSNGITFVMRLYKRLHIHPNAILRSSIFHVNINETVPHCLLIFFCCFFFAVVHFCFFFNRSLSSSHNVVFDFKLFDAENAARIDK